MKLTLIGTLILTYLLPSPCAWGGIFEQQEVEQGHFIAIARPYGENKYDLLVLQQIPEGQQCWHENGSNPVTVEPLLLNFDFTGSCERSTDSNGYSLRLDGEDYGLDYLLKIVERNGELVLIAIHRRNTSQSELIIGRTYGKGQGLLKIFLNPGWKFTKRAYEGKTLGHVYLTGDTQAINPPQELLAANSPTQTTRQKPETPSTEEPSELTFTAPEIGPPISSEISTDDAAIENNTPSSEISDTTIIENNTPLIESNPLPESPQKTVIPPPLSLPSSDSNAQTVPPPPPTTSNNSNNSNDTDRKTLSDVLVVNSRQGPNNNTNPPPVVNPQNYRVMVEAKNSTEQAQIRSQYPDAFLSAYKGRSLWQIGVFSSQENAEIALKSLTNLGLKGVIVPF